ncbi:steroid 5 alpha-reductase [Colletotrichum higginsianum]|uniref:Steroid 5 alpha-reductase n=1 Tax=Colletotrichum higginsianum (strain IMI 349063) TaxID=759273 RepID=H1VD96_COLHI|nr:steroid 5 alpha-reductase [Colletotrichum higginsianum]
MTAALRLGFGGVAQFVAGIAIFYRRQEKAVAASKGGNGGKGVHKHYRIPEAMLFRYMLYPHYFCEWVEWFGFWMASGWSVPGRAFLLNEIFVMFPRARSGRRWYVDQFGEEKIRKKWTIVPGVY